MKAKELMIGDYVTFKDSLANGTILKIKIIALGENETLVQIDGDDACDIIAIDDEIVGIPLTTEILEKNGFVYNDIPFVQGWEQFGLTLTHGGDGFRITCGQNVAMIIDSVHELQHALRLCGIEKEIEL